MINEWDGLVGEWITVFHWMLIGYTVVLDNGYDVLFKLINQYMKRNNVLFILDTLLVLLNELLMSWLISYWSI